MKNDQWFEPGDKVMRVANVVIRPSRIRYPRRPEFGKVYCVEWFRERKKYGNVVFFVGFGPTLYDENGFQLGWRAENFRKVEEIRLCVEALKRQPELAET